MKNNQRNRRRYSNPNFSKPVVVKSAVSNAPRAEVPAQKENTSVRTRNILIGLATVLLLMLMSYTWPKKSTSEVDDSPVVAKVGNEVITLADMEARKNAIPQLANVNLDDIYDKFLDNLIDRKVVLDAAKKSDIQDKKEVRRALKEAEENILIQAYLSDKIKERSTKQALQAAYQEALKDFKPQDEIHARHILVATEKEAKDIIVKLKAGADFAKLADQYSLDKGPNGTNGGDLGYFTKEMMIPDFGNPAFDMKVGEYSKKPVKTPFGYHIIKVEDKRKAAPPSFEASLEVLKVRFSEKELPNIIADMRKNAKVERFDVKKENK